jgi:hypothetical protein
MQLDRLGLHSHILPKLKAIDDAWDGERQFASECFDYAKEAEIFDCRALPIDFVAEAGAAAFEEMKALGSLVRLPYPCCYFEFGREPYGPSSVLAAEIIYKAPIDLGEALGDADAAAAAAAAPVLGTSVETWGFQDWEMWEPDDDGVGIGMVGSFDNGVVTVADEAGGYAPPEFFSVANCGVDWDVQALLQEEIATLAAKQLLGVLSLLSDKLLTSEHAPDPAPNLTKARERRGVLPITAARHVLRVNVAAIRAATRPVPIGSHESPCLHWRRGHWRVLHRGSEFEDRAWVKKCLVGNPDRGYAAKRYRLVKEPPLLSMPELPA